MDKNKVLIGTIAVLALILSSYSVMRPSTETVVRETVKELGAFPGPEIMSNYLVLNGTEHRYFHSGLNQASTTVCSFLTPVATSSLMFGAMDISTGTTTDTYWEVGKGSEMDATTTPLGRTLLTATRMTFFASTSPTGSVNLDDDAIFAPSTYLNFKYSPVDADAGITNTLVGTCDAEFIIH